MHFVALFAKRRRRETAGHITRIILEFGREKKDIMHQVILQLTSDILVKKLHYYGGGGEQTFNLLS